MKDANVFIHSEGASHSGPTATSLLRGVQGADEEAWKRLVDEYSGRVFRWIKGAGWQDADAKDLLQTVFLKVYRGLPEFRREHGAGTFRAWIRKITQHAIIDRRRLTLRDVAGEPTGGTDHVRLLQEARDEFDPRSWAATQQDEWQVAALIQAQSETTDEHWRIFVRYVVDGEEPEMLAAELGLMPGTIYTIKHRITKRVKAIHAKLIADKNVGRE